MLTAFSTTQSSFNPALFLSCTWIGLGGTKNDWDIVFWNYLGFSFNIP